MTHTVGKPATGPVPTAAAPIVFIVGDRYEAFADHTDVHTVSQFITRLRAGSAGRADGDSPQSRRPMVLAEGQGLTDYDWARIADALYRCGLADHTTIVRAERGRPAGHLETHKCREENVLIAGLEQVGETRFRAALRLHNEQEFQLDHQAGHVQGMVVLEAARQMYVAVCERFYTVQWPDRAYSYMFDSMESKFRNFLYPLDTTIDCTVLAADLDDPEHLVFDIRNSFEQAGLHAATVRMTGAVVEHAWMSKKERRGATRAVRYALKSVSAHEGDRP